VGDVARRPNDREHRRPGPTRAAAADAGDVTRQRIYLETMERVLGGTDKTIIDTGGRSSPGVVPYLPLTSLPRERATQQQQPVGGNQ
jgi:modulator of FtsH protease HflK